MASLDNKFIAFIKDLESTLKKSCFPVHEIVSNLKGIADYIESQAIYAEMRYPFVYGGSKQGLCGNGFSIDDKFSWRYFDNASKPFWPDTGEQTLYRVIRRGGNRIGPRRGVLFAQDFNLDLNIPVSYSIDTTDPYLPEFLTNLSSYLNPETVCYVNYFSSEETRELNLGDILSSI